MGVTYDLLVVEICFFFLTKLVLGELAEGEITLSVRTGEVVSARPVGNLKLFFGDRFIILDNVLFVPGIKEI